MPSIAHEVTEGVFLRRSINDVHLTGITILNLTKRFKDLELMSIPLEFTDAGEGIYMEDKVYKVGVIGTGGISRAHSNGYKAVKRTEIIAGADVSEEQLKKYGKEYGIDKFYTDYIEMVKAEKPDIVSVCTWVNSHCEIVTKVAKLGIVKGILCEKPMALSMEEADQMVEACEKAGIKFAIGHQRRHAAQHQKTKELIDSNAIGDLVWLWGSSPPDLLDWGTHVADMMLFYAGEVEWLMGQIGGRNPEQHRRGYYHAHPAQGYMKFKNGARGIVPKSIDNYANYNARLRLSGHGTNSGR